MNPLALITNLLRLGCLYLEWKLATLPEQANRYADETEDEIERLRELGTPAATTRADRLRARLARRRGFAQTLSTSLPTPAGGPARADDGRGSPPSSG